MCASSSQVQIPRNHGKKNKATANSKISNLKVFHTCEIAQNLHMSRQKIHDSAAEKPLTSQTLKFDPCHVKAGFRITLVHTIFYT